MKEVILYCDGASRGNPGPAAYGFVLLEGTTVIEEGSGQLGTTTNNVAEYQGLIQGLKRCQQLDVEKITVRCDSELMVRQLAGRYKVKAPHLKPLFEQARQLIQGFSSVDVVHVRRELNKEADRLANEALDAKV